MRIFGAVGHLRPSTLSLRAKRSNLVPACLIPSRLLRRCAPRNDKKLGPGFVSLSCRCEVRLDVCCERLDGRLEPIRNLWGGFARVPTPEAGEVSAGMRWSHNFAELRDPAFIGGLRIEQVACTKRK